MRQVFIIERHEIADLRRGIPLSIRFANGQEVPLQADVHHAPHANGTQPDSLTCDKCLPPRPFQSRQARGVHMSRIHGVKPSSRTRQRRRKRRRRTHRQNGGD